MKNTKGSCLCGRVSYEVKAELRNIWLCHCQQCRKTSGHYVAATQCHRKDITINGEDALTWYASSPNAKRAFCSNCGSQMFWLPTDGECISIFAGSIDGSTDLMTEGQVHTKTKGDYYELPNVSIGNQADLKR